MWPEICCIIVYISEASINVIMTENANKTNFVFVDVVGLVDDKKKKTVLLMQFYNFDSKRRDNCL